MKESLNDTPNLHNRRSFENFFNNFLLLWTFTLRNSRRRNNNHYIINKRTHSVSVPVGVGNRLNSEQGLLKYSIIVCKETRLHTRTDFKEVFIVVL